MGGLLGTRRRARDVVEGEGVLEVPGRGRRDSGRVEGGADRDEDAGGEEAGEDEEGEGGAASEGRDVGEGAEEVVDDDEWKRAGHVRKDVLHRGGVTAVSMVRSRCASSPGST